MGVIPPPGGLPSGVDDNDILYAKSKKIAGSADFTFTEDTGSGPRVTVSGNQPAIYIIDDTDATDYRTEFIQSGASLYVQHGDSAGTHKEVIRIASGSIMFNNDGESYDTVIHSDYNTSGFACFYVDASRNNIGMGTDDPSATIERLHIVGTGTGKLVRLESTDSGADTAPILDLMRNSSSVADGDTLGRITFSGKDSDGDELAYALMTAYLIDKDDTGDNPDGQLRLQAMMDGTAREFVRIGSWNSSNPDVRATWFNPGTLADQDFKIYSGSGEMFWVDSGADKVYIGATNDGAKRLMIPRNNGWVQSYGYGGLNTGDGSVVGSNKFGIDAGGGDAALHFLESTDGWLVKHRAADNAFVFQQTLTGDDRLVLDWDGTPAGEGYNAYFRYGTVGSRVKILEKNDNYTVTGGDLHNTYIHMTNTSSDGNKILTLPTAGVGMHLRAIMGGTGTFQFAADGSDTINGSTSNLTVSTQYQIAELVAVAANTWVCSVSGV